MRSCCPNALPTIVYVHARRRNYWHFTTRKPNDLRLLQQTLRHNKASSKNALHFTNPTVADPSRSVDGDVDEDERDDEISEPTQITKAVKRKEIQMDETAKELRAPLQIAASSHASSLRPADETQEQLVRSAKQARKTKIGVETLQDVSFLFQKRHCEHQRDGFL